MTQRTEKESISFLEGFKTGVEIAIEYGAEEAQKAYEKIRKSHMEQFGEVWNLSIGEENA